MVDRMFGEMDVLMTDDLMPRQQVYLQTLQNTGPPPWSEYQKAILKPHLRRIQSDLDKWNGYITTLQQKASRMRAAGDQAELYYRIDTWKRTHKAVIDGIEMDLLQAAAFMEMPIENPAINVPVAAPEPSSPKKLKIKDLNIQKFDGDYMKWKAFWQRFEINVHNHPFSNVEKMDALVGLLEGEALDEIAGFEISEENYDTVVKTLLDRFGNTKLVLKKLYSNLHAVPPASSSAKSLRSTVNIVTNMCRQLQNFGVDINNDSLQSEIIGKMPPREKNELTWIQLKNDDTTTEVILEKMKEFALKAEIFYENNSKNSPAQSKPLSNPANHTPKFSGSSKKFACSLCEGDHLASDCPKYVSAEDKVKQLQAKNYCTKCAWRNHTTKQCQANARCKNCDGHHYTFLCKTRNSANSNKPTTTKAFASIGAQHGCLLTKRVTVINPETKRTAVATVFFDPGSQRSFVSDYLIHQLKLPRDSQQHLNLQGIGAKATNYMSSLVKLQIKTTESFEEIYANSIKKIANSVPVISSDEIDPKLFTVTNYPPDILIGIDYFWQFVTSFEKKDRIVIVHSKVGQMLSGNIYTVSNSTISALAIEPQKLHNFDDELQNLWKLEAMGIKDQEPDEIETQILEKFKDSIKFEENRFYVSWPTKPGYKPLPTNEGLAIGRLNSTLKKLSFDPKLFKEYQDIFDNQLKLGTIELAPKIPQGGLVHYIPHHAVITPQKTTTKVRMVFDGSAKCSKDAPSLNDCFIRGPLQMPDICGMLMRIRTSKYLVMGDIEKAFHQIYLNEKDRDAVRFYWVKDPLKPARGDNLIIFRFVAVPFGIISSPFILWIIILILLQKIENVELRQMIAENTYVDNIFLMCDEEKQGIEFFNQTRSHFLTASMNVREWLSNGQQINAAIPSQIKQPETIAKVLGIYWNSQEDTLMVKLDNLKQAHNWTKRSVLKFIASSFDPLGILSPVTIRGKMFIQKLFQQGYPWDTPLNKDLQKEWQMIVNDWNGEIKIPRKLVHGTMPQKDSIEIHTFADASEAAYCACTYIRSKTSMGYETSLVFAKSKLRPLNKDLTIPKMEIMGIWLAAKISTFVAKELKLETSKKFIWTDSQISFYWFQKLPKDVFVKNRLKFVLASNVDVLFVPGKINPADLGTRGISFDELSKATSWWHGPKFLQLNEESWPKLPKFGEDITQTLGILVATGTTENTVTLQNIETHREFEIDTNLSWTNLKVTIAMKLKNVESEQQLTAKDLMQIESMLIKQEQGIYITPEIQQHLKLTKNEDGIYCINTRFDHAELINPHPMFLPKDSPVTKLIVMDIHLKLHHSGIPHTLSKIRETYWIPSGRITVQKILQKCKSCKVWKGKPFTLPHMPQLPASRINKSKPFQNTGVDYCGPFKIKGQKEKVWILLFTCFTTRLVHLEPVTSMASDDFLLSFRRFVARRGIPHYVLSDNAKQFKTTAATLDRIWKEAIKDEQAIKFFNENGILWDFITERAPWKGGLYERLVSLVKNAIKQTLGQCVLDFNQFWTFLNEVESTLNSRPLTYIHAKEAIVIRPIDFILPQVEIRLPATVSDDHQNDSTYIPSNAAGGEYLAELYYKTIQYLDKFWTLWSKDYLNLLRERNNNIHKNIRGSLQRRPNVNEKVMVYEADTPRGSWKIATIKNLIESSDGEVRSAEIEYDEGFTTRRAVNHLYPLEEDQMQLHGSNLHNIIENHSQICLNSHKNDDNSISQSFTSSSLLSGCSFTSYSSLSTIDNNSKAMIQLSYEDNLSMEELSSSDEQTFEQEFPGIKVKSHVVVVTPDLNKVKEKELSAEIKKKHAEILETKNQQVMVIKLFKEAIDEAIEKFEATKNILDESTTIPSTNVVDLEKQLDKILAGIKAVNTIEQEKQDLEDENFSLRQQRRDIRDVIYPRGKK